MPAYRLQGEVQHERAVSDSPRSPSQQCDVKLFMIQRLLSVLCSQVFVEELLHVTAVKRHLDYYGFAAYVMNHLNGPPPCG